MYYHPLSDQGIDQYGNTPTYRLIDAWTDDHDHAMDDAPVQVVGDTVQIYVPGGVVSLTLDDWRALAAWVEQQVAAGQGG